MKTNTQSLLLIPLLACFALSPTAQALNPPPDGGYPNGNTAEGTGSLFSLTTGSNNTAMGFQALYSNTTGGFNTANGATALYSNVDGALNTATGFQALYSNTGGNYNTANGAGALYNNLGGGENTADGQAALFNNTDGGGNTANGSFALFNNTTGGDNTANGHYALISNTEGFFNTADGSYALFNSDLGAENTAVGFQALMNNTEGNNNIAVGYSAGLNLTTGEFNIDIGNEGVFAESRTIRIGTQGTQTATFVAGISGATVAKGVAVVIDANGHLGTKTSSARFKDEIKPMDKASEVILALKPVTFRYKKELDPERTPQFGLVAEEVARVNPDLVARNADGEIYTVRYDAVNAMLLNEFLKEHRKVRELEKQVEKLTVGLQKVSDQLDLRKPAPRTVANNQ